jgi:transcriptional regulator with XRE-family HTH domain
MWTIGDAVHVDDLGALIQRVMDENDWTISTIARRSGLAVSTVHAWKSGDRATGSRGPAPKNLRKLAEGMNVTPAEVFRAAGRHVPGTMSPDDRERFVDLLEVLSDDNRRVIYKTMQAMAEPSGS